jgi:hypothetical protein
MGNTEPTVGRGKILLVEDDPDIVAVHWIFWKGPNERIVWQP